MDWTVLLLIPVVVGVAVWGMRVRARRARRNALLSATLPQAWQEILRRNLPPYASLSDEERRRLHGTTNVFLAEKRFEGCGGLVLSDEVRVTIAAQACMLLLNRPVAVYPKLRTVLVYPSTYVVGKRGLFGDEEPVSVRLGESWQRGVVVLAWDSVKGGAANFDDGHNVALHEFAHQLDQEDGRGDGAPLLDSPSAYQTWARVFSREYESLRGRIKRGRRTVMESYGATNPAEFFAVATETFFEKPKQLHAKHPALYEELRQYYRTDPLRWTD